MNIQEFMSLDRFEYYVMALDFIVVLVMLTIMGKAIGLVANVNSIHELSEKDNHAFGVSFAGALIALGIMLTGAVSGDETISLLYELSIVSAYGVLGLVLMVVTRFVLDRISLPRISIHQQILSGNQAAAILDAANMIATAIIIRAVMMWVDTESFQGLAFVVLGFVASQFLMIAVTKYRTFVYGRRHNGECIQAAFEAGNIALSIRYFGHKVGAALAVTAASGIVTYSTQHEFVSAMLWLGASVVMVIILSLVSILARHIILRKVDVVQEVDDQSNIAIGLIEAVIYVVIGLLLAGLFSVSAY